MGYINFDEKQLVNLEYSLKHEVLRENRLGTYLSTTIAGCNTRKYHGLLVCPLPELDGGKHVLLSSLDETIVQYGSEFHLGIHQYAYDLYVPRGHKYIEHFDTEVSVRTVFRVGGVLLSREMLLVEDQHQLLIRYRLEEAGVPVLLRLSPFLAFRNIHCLSQVNMQANVHSEKVENGMRCRLYDEYPFLNMQFSKEVDFVVAPDWFHQIFYYKEMERGYDDREDLLVPGYFELPLKKGESVVFSAALNESRPGGFKSRFTREYKKYLPESSFLNCLYNAADQFVVSDSNQKDLVAGLPWYTGSPRQTFIALPGLMLERDEPGLFHRVLQSQLKWLKNGLFPVYTGTRSVDYHAMDVPLWLFWSLQQEVKIYHNQKEIWRDYGSVLKNILTAYEEGTDFGIHQDKDGLITGSDEHFALTWMDSAVDGVPVVARRGKPVEVNALWYNAVCFSLELAGLAEDRHFVDHWASVPDRVSEAFIQCFWNTEKEYLADFIGDGQPDWTVRPNMVIAAALDYSPLSREQKKKILSIVRQQLLTPRGLRTLSPSSICYRGQCHGTVREREEALHQGSAYPWLIQFFAEAYLQIHQKGGIHLVQRIIDGFEPEIADHCVGSIAELYNGNPPHVARGALSQAWNVAALIRTYKLMINFAE